MGMAMFRRTFARTIPDNLRPPHMKMWGFEAKRARKFTRTSPRTLPWNFITMVSAPLIFSLFLTISLFGTILAYFRWRKSTFRTGERFVNDTSRASTGFEFTRHSFMWFPIISPHTLPSASREIPSCSPQKESPNTPRKGKHHPPPPHPQPTHTPTTTTQRDRERRQNQPPSNRPKR